MPILLKKEIKPAGEYGIWQVTEEAPYFLSKMTLHPHEDREIVDLKSRKKLEWLASRYLLHLMSGRAARGACIKDSYGKPYLEDSDQYISMSHSGDRVAVIASPYLVGIDIQRIVPKIERISQRFMSDEELSHIHYDHRIEMMHVIWGAKECLYKAYGKRGLDFRQHISTTPFVYNEEEMTFKGEVHYSDFHHQFNIFAYQLEEYILVNAIIQD